MMTTTGPEEEQELLPHSKVGYLTEGLIMYHTLPVVEFVSVYCMSRNMPCRGISLFPISSLSIHARAIIVARMIDGNLREIALVTLLLRSTLDYTVNTIGEGSYFYLLSPVLVDFSVS